MKKTDIVLDDGREQAVREALVIAERRHTRELKAALQRLEREMTREKTVALTRQKQASLILRSTWSNVDVCVRVCAHARMCIACMHTVQFKYVENL